MQIKENLGSLDLTEHGKVINKIKPLIQIWDHQILWILILKQFPSSEGYINQILCRLNMDQILKCHEIIRHLQDMAEEYFKIMIKNNRLIKALKGFQVAVRTMNKHQLGITRLHSIFLKSCIKTKMYKFGLNVVNNVPCGMKKMFKLHLRDFVGFYYYSGMIHLGLENFTMAKTYLDSTGPFRLAAASIIDRVLQTLSGPHDDGPHQILTAAPN